MKLLISLCMILTSCAPVMADSLFLGAWSTHFDKGDYNEQHNLVAYERDDWVLGYFKNSYNRDTFFVAKDFYKRFGLDAAAVAVRIEF